MAKFEKGFSGNPGGRPKEVAEIRELARQHTPEAINTLAEIMADKSIPPAARVSAANALIDRGWGKAAQAIKGDYQFTLVVNTGVNAPMTLPVLEGSVEMALAISDQSVYGDE